jgi:hypothetical protein
MYFQPVPKTYSRLKSSTESRQNRDEDINYTMDEVDIQG